MKALLATGLLVLAALAVAPSTQAAIPIECVMAPCGPGPIGVPHCPNLTVGTGGLVSWIGPGAAVAIHSDCTVTVIEAGLPCPSLAPKRGHAAPHAGPVGASADTCTPDLDCTCDPVAALESDSASPAMQVPPPCQYCTCSEDHVEGALASVDWTNCHVRVVVHDNVYDCLVPQDVTVSVVTVHPDDCQPICACMPASSAAAVEPPVQVEVVQCVRGPCPPQVTCTVSTSHVGIFQVDRSRSCHLTLTQDPLACEGTRHTAPETVGPVAVIRSECGPGIQE